MAAKRRKKRKVYGWRAQLLSVALLIGAIVFMPTTIFLFFGMLPTIAAAVVDKRGKGTKAITVGAMNLAGCTPFLLDMWTTNPSPEQALSMIMDPRTVVVIYSAASIGYLVDWSLSGVVRTVMIQRSKMRLDEITKRQEGLVARWGREVTGEIPLDSNGFPILPDHSDGDNVRNQR